MFVEDLKARALIGQQRMAEVVDTSTLSKDQAEKTRSDAAVRWANIKRQIADSTEMQAEVVRVTVFTLKYHSVFSQALLDELLALASADGLTPSILSVPNPSGTRDILLEFDIKGTIAALDAAPVTP